MRDHQVDRRGHREDRLGERALVAVHVHSADSVKILDLVDDVPVVENQVLDQRTPVHRNRRSVPVEVVSCQVGLDVGIPAQADDAALHM